MKKRLIITAVIIFLAVAASSIYTFFYSPISGSATAAQLNATVGSYATAKFIRDGLVEKTIVVIASISIFFTWINWIFHGEKSKQKQK